MNGRVVAVLVKPGEQVDAGQPVMTLEAMKMEHVHTAGVAGTVSAIDVAEGEQVTTGRIVVEIEAATSLRCKIVAWAKALLCDAVRHRHVVAEHAWTVHPARRIAMSATTHPTEYSARPVPRSASTPPDACSPASTSTGVSTLQRSIT